MKNIFAILVAFAIAVPSFSQLTFSTVTSFTDNPGTSSHPCAIVDMNKDGLEDIVRLIDGSDLYINFQQEDGNFTELFQGGIFASGWGSSSAWGMCVADIDGNGTRDVLAGGSYNQIKILYLDEGLDTLVSTDAPGPQIFLQAINCFDINHDGWTDMFGCHDDGPSKITLNDGAGTMTYDSDIIAEIFNTSLYETAEDNSGNYGSVWSDVNNDGHTDCYITKCRQGVTSAEDPRRINQLWLYNPITSSYEEAADAAGIASGAQGWSSDFGDIDNDGDMDLFVANHDVDSELFLNNGDGTFSDISLTSGIMDPISFAIIQSTFRDFDNDGWIDLIISGGGSFIIFRNNGDNSFSEFENTNIDFNLNSYALGDLNDDGFIDIYGTTGGYGSFGADADDIIILNDGNDNHWVKVELEGVESNIDGIGAWITIEGAFGTQTREIKSGESYGIMNSLQAHFGIGENSSISKLTVNWPSGIIDQIIDPDIDQMVYLLEGSSPVGIHENKRGLLGAFPNPTNQILTINGGESMIRDVAVFDVSGQLVLTHSNINQKSTQITIDQAGMYLIVISDIHGNQIQERVVVSQ